MGKKKRFSRNIILVKKKALRITHSIILLLKVEINKIIPYTRWIS